MFDFSRHMSLLCRDVVRLTPELTHIDMSRVAITFAQTRTDAPHGTQARLTALRFRDGSPTTVRRGRRFRMQSVVIDGREMLYLVTFYLPRFLNHAACEKLVIVVHELYHISERFDGDVRRLSGRNYAHTHSRRNYDNVVRHMARQYLRRNPDPRLRTFLEWDFRELTARHGGVRGLRVPVPRLLPVDP